ncbi:MAG: DUF4340 domain-containing protein [Kiritimatiellae bacterium]|nr:DUF4340 domain-containing protein [Kiritimatiellia bacterium]
MVSKSTIGGLALLLAALLAGLRIMSTTDAERTAAAGIAPLAVSTPSAVVFSRGDGEEVRIVRSGGGWALASPESGRADPAVVGGVLAALAGGGVRDRITPRQRAGRGLALEDFGLAPPVASVTLSFAGMDDFQIDFGIESPGGGVFAKSSASDDVLVVPRSAFDALPSSLDACRDRALVPSAGEPPVAFEIRRRGEVPTKVERGADGQWAVAAPFPLPADQEVAERACAALAGRNIRRFVVSPGTNETASAALRLAHGLSPEEAAVSVAVWTREGSFPEVFFFGDGDPSDAGSVFVSSSDGMVFTVDENLTEAVSPTLDEIRDRRIFAFSISDVDSFSVRSAGRERVELRRDNAGAWAFASPSPAETEEKAVDGYLAHLLSWCDTAVRMDSASDPAALTANGDGFAVSFRLRGAEEPLEYAVVKCLPEETAPFWAAKIVGRESPLRVLDDLADPATALSDASLAALRSRTVLTLSGAAVEAVAALDADGRAFPLGAAAAAAMLGLVSNFNAQATCAISSPDPSAWGLLPPRAQWSFSTSIPERPVVILQMGAALANGSVFVRVKGDNAVFLASAADSAVLESCAGAVAKEGEKDEKGE